MNAPGHMVEVGGGFATRSDAELAQGALAAAGISSVIEADDAGGAYPFDLTGGARLLVEQEDARPDHERARERHALLHAARQLAGLHRARLRQAHERERLLDALTDLRPRHRALPQAEGDVLGDRHVRKQRIGLEHHAEAASPRGLAGDVAAVEDDTARVRRHEARDDVECRRLAASRRAEQRKHLALVDREIDPGERVHRAVALANRFEDNDGLQFLIWNTRERFSTRSATKTTTNVAPMKIVDSAAIVGSV